MLCLALVVGASLLTAAWVGGTSWNAAANRSTQQHNASWGKPITATITNPRTTDVFKEFGNRRAVANIRFTSNNGSPQRIQRVMEWDENGLPRTTSIWQRTDGKLFVAGDVKELGSKSPLGGKSNNRDMLMAFALTATACAVVITSIIDRERNKKPPLKAVAAAA